MSERPSAVQKYYHRVGHCCRYQRHRVVFATTIIIDVVDIDTTIASLLEDTHTPVLNHQRRRQRQSLF